MIRTDNNGHTVSTIQVFPELHAATVVARMQPGFRFWSRPSAADTRKWVDAAIAESAYPSWRRLGRATITQTATTWVFAFKLGD